MSYTPTEWEPTDVVTATRMNALEQAVGDMNMSYTPNTWSDGDILSAEKMNALEQAVASGGGSSDFSTAQVTFVNNTGASSVASVPNCVEENALGSGSPATVTYFVPTQDATPVVANVPLYKGSCYGFWDTNDEQFEISVSGDVALMGGGTILITGDCTITIS